LPSLAQCPCPLLLEIKVKKGNRKDLGRPTTTPIENKIAFMDNLNKNGNN
jgi:phosphonopyruvate decarboxylase